MYLYMCVYIRQCLAMLVHTSLRLSAISCLCFLSAGMCDLKISYFMSSQVCTHTLVTPAVKKSKPAWATYQASQVYIKRHCFKNYTHTHTYTYYFSVAVRRGVCGMCVCVYTNNIIGSRSGVIIAEPNHSILRGLWKTLELWARKWLNTTSSAYFQGHARRMPDDSSVGSREDRRGLAQGVSEKARTLTMTSCLFFFFTSI